MLLIHFCVLYFLLKWYRHTLPIELWMDFVYVVFGRFQGRGYTCFGSWYGLQTQCVCTQHTTLWKKTLLSDTCLHTPSTCGRGGTTSSLLACHRLTENFSVQAVGWSILLFLIVLGALARLIKPCFDDHATFLQTRYWSNYLDIEQKLFDETCVLHARDFARKCVVQFFEDMREDTIIHLPHPPFFNNFRDESEDEEEERLHGITKQEQLDQLLNKWYYSKPELDVTKAAYRPRACVTWENRKGNTLYSDV